jgi:type I restriction enzyme, S subunit
LAGANVTRGIVPIRFAAEKISHQFGYYLLRSEPAQLQIQAKTYSTALQQINIRDLRQLTLPVSAPQDQETIIQRLSALEEETKQLTAVYENKLTAIDAPRSRCCTKPSAGSCEPAIKFRRNKVGT